MKSFSVDSLASAVVKKLQAEFAICDHLAGSRSIIKDIIKLQQLWEIVAVGRIYTILVIDERH